MLTHDFWNFTVHWLTENRPRRRTMKAIKAKGKPPKSQSLSQKSASAKSLLLNPTFNQAYAELLQNLQDGIAETKLEDKDVRESLYLQIRALVLLVTKLNHFSQEYEAMLQQTKENNVNG